MLRDEIFMRIFVQYPRSSIRHGAPPIISETVGEYARRNEFLNALFFPFFFAKELFTMGEDSIIRFAQASKSSKANVLVVRRAFMRSFVLRSVKRSLFLMLEPPSTINIKFV